MIPAHLRARPEDIGLDGAKVEELLARVAREVEEGLLPACQVALARNGRVGALATFGAATDDSLFNVFSCTKAITSAAAWLLVQEGRLDLSTRVAALVPEFGTNGKDVITVEQLFTHTAGFPHAPFRPVEWRDRAQRLQRFAEWTLNWPPGSRYEYHPTSSMYVIGEIIERLSDRPFDAFVRERIAEPLGLAEFRVSCPASEHHRIVPVVHVGDAIGPSDYEKLGLPVPPATEVTEEALSAFNTAEVRASCVPGGSGVMSAAELALFYQALLDGGARVCGRTLWQPATLADALRVRNRFPDIFGTPVNRALGVVVAGDDKRNARGFGHTNSPLAFGHGGAGGQLGWADPATGISLGYCTNGHDRNVFRQGRRSISIANRAAVCALAV
jgi:CubicO group peptidase (beta-lactamase class C family)